MNESEGAASTKRRRQPRRRQIVLTILAMLLLLGAVGWWQMPRTYRVRHRWKTCNVTLLSSTAGFMVCEARGKGAIDYVLRDWTGKEQWRIRLSLPTDMLPTGPNASLSIDGNTLAVAIPTKKNWLLLAYQQGVNSYRSPISTRNHIVQVRALQDGQVLAWETSGDAPAIYLFKQGRIAARGKLPFPGHLSPDGTACIAQSGEYASVEIRGAKIIATHYQQGLQFQSYGALGASHLGANGCVLTSAGAVYGPTGLLVKAGGWEHDEITFDGRYTLQWLPGKGQARIYSIDTGSSWSFPYKSLERFEGGFATQDGRHALVARPMLPEVLLPLLRTIPTMRDSMANNPERFIRLVLLEQPGKTRAGILINKIMTDHSIESWGYSPDGRSLAFVYGTDESNSERYYCKLFRW